MPTRPTPTTAEHERATSPRATHSPGTAQQATVLAPQRGVNKRPTLNPLGAQQTQGNQAAQRSLAKPVVQRYAELRPDEYTPQANVVNAALPMFDERSPDPTIDAANATVRYPKTNNPRPPLYVADDGSLAINKTNNEPKEFYALDQVVTNANNDLAAQMSTVELDNSVGHVVDINGQQLKMVRPKKRGQAINIAAGEFANFMEHKCVNVALQFMGKQRWQDFKADAVLQDQRVGGGDTTNVTLNPGGSDVPEARKLAKFMSDNGNQPADQEDAATAIQTAADPGYVGKEYGTKLGKGQLDQSSESLGVNQFAKASGIGQGYATVTHGGTAKEPKADYSELQSRFMGLGEKPTQRDSVWGYHFAAVSAVSLNGLDQITLENYNRTPELQGKLAELQTAVEQRYKATHGATALKQFNTTLDTETASASQRIAMTHATLQKGAKATAGEAQAVARTILENAGTMWFFRIVGSKAGQSFHEQMASSGYFANPMTLVVKPPVETTPEPFFFVTDAAALQGTERNQLIGADRIAKIQSDLAHYPESKVQVVGYSTPTEATTTPGIAQQRAQDARTLLTTNHVPGGRIILGDGGATTTFKQGRPDVASANQRVMVSLEK